MWCCLFDAHSNQIIPFILSRYKIVSFKKKCFCSGTYCFRVTTAVLLRCDSVISSWLRPQAAHCTGMVCCCHYQEGSLVQGCSTSSFRSGSVRLQDISSTIMQKDVTWLIKIKARFTHLCCRNTCLGTAAPFVLTNTSTHITNMFFRSPKYLVKQYYVLLCAAFEYKKVHDVFVAF